MSMVDHDLYAAELFGALRTRSVLEPLIERVPLTIDDAYRISEGILRRRLAEGETLVGKKIGVTSPAVQNMLGVHQPDFGYLTDAMLTGEAMPISQRLIQPRAEGEIAFILSADLVGPGITPDDVLAATETVHACFEVVDSRIRDWRIGIEDTIADNASSGLFVMGPGVRPDDVDFEGCHMRVTKNGELLSEGYGRNTVGSPLKAVAWLANTLGGFGVPLKAGEIILSGSLVALEPVVPGDVMRCDIDGIGSCTVRFT